MIHPAVVYELGDCFRCDRAGLQVTRIGEITGPEGETPLVACRSCVERLLAMHLGAHENPVRQYVRQ
ncbi:hypothetical protein OG292_10855 [Streptomyces sp. NBC_01511]|uniref:hypothetical protein n=1 Tax=Streptomyces sp. NBC_01511 TaxID=2903889 RepID=UPI00386D17D3